jgi:signal transduction histidine kinase
MKSQWFKIIAPIYFLCFAFSVTATQNDSLKSRLDTKLQNAIFNQEEEVKKYLEITDKIYTQFPADGLFYVIALEEQLKINNNNTGRAYILIKKGTYYWLQGIYDASLKAFFQALNIFEEEGNTIEVIKTLNNIGETYKKQKDYIQSAKFIQLALAESKKAKGLSPQLILVNLGQLFMINENYDSANYYLDQVLNQDSLSSQIKGFTNLYKGMVNQETGDTDSALLFLQESLKDWDQIKYTRGTVETTIEIARVYIAQNNLLKANQFLESAEMLALKANTLDLLLKIYQSKIDLYQLTGINDSLTFYFDKYLGVKDSIFNSESRAEINKLTIQYDLSQKEKESYKLALQQSQLANEIENRTQFLILLALALIFSIIMLFYLRNKSNQLKNAHIKLKQQKEEIEDKQKKLSSKSLDLARVNKELHSLNRNLEERVLERTKKLNERNRQIAEFTYYNSHKLRAPVANVLGLINVIELTKDGKIDPKVLSYLKISANELDKVIFNLKNLLELDEPFEE